MLRAKSISAPSFQGLSEHLKWPFSAHESLLLVPTLLMALGFSIFSDGFGKAGIPINLPEGLGGVPEMAPKIYPMELFLAWAAAVTAASLRPETIRNAMRPFPLAVLAFVLFGLARALPDFSANPLLVIRNSAFVWYLALPLFVALFPIPAKSWERFFRILYATMFAYFVLYFAYPPSQGSVGGIFWNIDYGLLFALAFGLCHASSPWSLAALAAIGYALGIGFLSQVQRTTLLGLTGTAILLALAFLMPAKFPRPKWRRIGALLAGAAMSVAVAAAVKSSAGREASPVDTIRDASPLRPSESLGSGVEKFRFFMWKDAADRFLSSPLHGIGFLSPVVFRVYAGDDRFFDNTGSFEHKSQFNFERKTPPISGPHNSYLNALARLGLPGAALLVFHLLAAWIFFRRSYYACFFVLLWQMLYASFNVSFEGPIRSFPILLLLGVALKASTEKSRVSAA